MTSRLVVPIGVFLLTAGCSTGTEPSPSVPSWQSTPSGVEHVSSGTDAEKYFPLKDGTLYQYETMSLGDAPSAQKGMLPMHVRRVSATVGELHKPGRTQSFEYTPLGIATKTKSGAVAYLLRLPLNPSTTWLGPQGGQTHVDATNQSFDSQAGHFTGCITTLEERGGDAPLRVSTMLCPDVGIVRLEVQSGGVAERAELSYFGPVVNIGPDGLKRVQ